MSDELKAKINWSCKFNNRPYQIIEGYLRIVEHKMFGKEKERENYWTFSKNLYNHNIFSDKTIESIQNDYIWNKENDKGKEKDDYSIEM